MTERNQTEQELKDGREYERRFSGWLLKEKNRVEESQVRKTQQLQTIFEIAETLAGLDRLLASTAGVLAPQGSLILDSTDLRDTADEDGDEGFESESEREPENGPESQPDDDLHYIGELQYQLSVGPHSGDVFPQLFVDPDTLDARARLAGWDMDVIWSGSDGRYLSRLQRIRLSHQ